MTEDGTWPDQVLVLVQTLEIQVLTLLLMLVCVILTIVWADWKLSKGMGIVFGVLYVVFVTESLLLEYDQLGV